MSRRQGVVQTVTTSVLQRGCSRFGPHFESAGEYSGASRVADCSSSVQCAGTEGGL